MKYKILVIDRDAQSRKLISGILSKKYDIFFAKSVNEGYLTITSQNPDIIIIDPSYPKNDGINFIKSLREYNDCPVIAISVNGTENNVVAILDAGADDFIRKPFFSSELNARISVCVRRIAQLKAARAIPDLKIYKNGDLTVDLTNSSVFLEKERQHLTKNELKLLELLCIHSGKVLTNEFILKNIWGPKADSDTGVLRVNIRNLRHKLEKKQKYIFTENGIGYRLAENSYK